MYDFAVVFSCMRVVWSRMACHTAWPYIVILMPSREKSQTNPLPVSVQGHQKCPRSRREAEKGVP